MSVVASSLDKVNLYASTPPAVNPLADLVQPPTPEPSAPAINDSLSGQSGRHFLAFYGLNENPFADSVNPTFFYKTESHRMACERLLLAVEQNVSLAMVTGLSGTGKTLITQLLLQALDTAHYEPILVLVSPGLSKTGLLREILSELNVALPAGINRTRDLIKMVSNAIIDLYREGRKLVLLIDECHFLDADGLHIVRTISNVEIPERKLTTCLLFGEARFATRLNRPGYESLRNRMFFRSELPPMTADDCAQYIKFRTLVAGRIADLFDADALRAVAEHTGGICRSVNKLCMLALIEGSIRRQPLIDRATIDACAAML
ncbi:MAG: AAA family ATPase [Lentisphaerae bacterium]|nr:AAA family ATPase [Lentisphaerota bacterium]